MFVIAICVELITGRISFKAHPFARKRVLDRRERPVAYFSLLAVQLVVLGLIAYLFFQVSGALTVIDF